MRAQVPELLVEAGLRTRCSLLVESDEPRDTLVLEGVVPLAVVPAPFDARELLSLSAILRSALMAGAAGVHVGQDDLPPDAVRRLALVAIDAYARRAAETGRSMKVIGSPREMISDRRR